MPKYSPIYSVAKDLNLDSNRVLLACKTLGINAKGATKKLNEEEIIKIKNYFEKGQNASQEIIDINGPKTKTKSKPKNTEEKTKITYFSNRLTGKS